MRLTLRTLLAYMDGILEPGDAEDIGKRIQESEQATNLLHRTRDVMRRLRLAAPSLGGRGPGLDPNTVAEYLDNTLPGDRVNDFEKVCLDSDVHLAEVAACHQVLALVLGEAAEIDPASRERMYRLPGAAEGEGPPATAVGQEESVRQPAEGKARRRPTVPDYLREPRKRRRFLPIAIGVLAVACIGVIVWGTWYLAGSDQASVDLPAGEETGLPEERPAPEPPEEAGSVLPEEPVPEEPSPEDAVPEEPVPEEPVPEVPEPVEGPEAIPPESPPMPDEEPEVLPAEPGEVVELPRPPQGQGVLMSDKEILLRLDPEASRWERVPLQGIVVSGEQLLSLPTYRPLLALMSAEITVQLVDGTRAELLPTDITGVPGVKAEYGQLVIRTAGKAGAMLGLQFGDHSGLITFGDAQSVVALEVTPERTAGTDPETETGWLVGEMYATGGEIRWEDASSGEMVRLVAGSRVRLSDQPIGAPESVKELPSWVGGENADSLEMGADRLASANLERELQVDRSVRLGAGLVLKELSDHSRRENRWLAARCLGYVGNFAPLVATLNDPDHPPVWTDQAIEHLRAGVARGPEAAAEVRRALEKEYGQEADGLYRMLWGYTEDDLRGGEATRLVEYLDHETLAVRTLSFWNLRDFFGLGLLYDPMEREAVRRNRMLRWRERLESGDIWPQAAAEPAAGPAESSQPAAVEERP